MLQKAEEMKKTVRDYLLSNNLVSPSDLSVCDAQLQEKGGSLFACLVDKKFIEPTTLAKALAEYAQVPYIEKITEKMADPALLGKVPLPFLRTNAVMPIRYEDSFYILAADPMHFSPIDDLQLILEDHAEVAVATQKDIIDAINRYYPLEGSKKMLEDLEEEAAEELEDVQLAEVEEKDILAMATEAPVIKLVNHILFQAVKRDASDIHIEPFEKELRVRYRIDGILYDVMSPPKRLQDALISRIKIMANLNIAEKRIPQDGRIDLKIAGKPYDIRVSILPVSFGERVVMRLLDKTRTFGKLQDMSFSERDYKLITKAIHKPNGIIYVTGPTGSGKTTTLYSILGELNRPEVNIVTVEDPVEYRMTGVGQVQVRDKVGLSFAASLRSILRQDPDIIMIGETRDRETAQIAIQAALTGHLVLSTLHTNNAPATITRLIDMGIEPFLIASSIELAMAQRLVRRLCDYCKVPYNPSQELLESIGLTEKEAEQITFYKAVGCSECNNTGYRGRLAIYEVMPMTPAIAQLTMERADTQVIRRKAIAEGMLTLLQDGVRKIKDGLTTIEEVLSVATIEHKVVE